MLARFVPVLPAAMAGTELGVRVAEAAYGQVD